MRRIKEYKRLFKVESDLDLAELKTTYRNLVKEWHPDKFHHDEELRTEAEIMSRQIIDAYHFLVSINAETIKQNEPEFKETVATATITDYKFVDGRLIVCVDASE